MTCDGDAIPAIFVFMRDEIKLDIYDLAPVKFVNVTSKPLFSIRCLEKGYFAQKRLFGLQRAQKIFRCNIFVIQGVETCFPCSGILMDNKVSTNRYLMMSISYVVKAQLHQKMFLVCAGEDQKCIP